ncbi:hypothetical protein [Streptomyces sp. NRRL S-118]|uniref:hypothetical protein n=1 Tax=Streptomyces sp. NRRL S-118 TaxID=1463881 RepID=UPI00099B7B48|nr:hypothetical protein [Streptomyces sp. NRRL S-118]
MTGDRHMPGRNDERAAGRGPVDDGNHVVRLCARGMQAEAEGRDADARSLFQRAWESAADDYEACVAAHYLARHQATAEETLHWNRISLARAGLVADDRVRSFYPSLYLNLAKAYLDLGRTGLAREQFGRAAEHAHHLPPGQYGDVMRFAIADGLRGTGAAVHRPAGGLIDGLVSGWCARADLRALALVLPARLGDLGTEEDRIRLVAALHLVHAGRWLPRGEQEDLGRAVAAVSRQKRGPARKERFSRNAAGPIQR